MLSVVPFGLSLLGKNYTLAIFHLSIVNIYMYILCIIFSPTNDKRNNASKARAMAFILLYIPCNMGWSMHDMFHVSVIYIDYGHKY